MNIKPITIAAVLMALAGVQVQANTQQESKVDKGVEQGALQQTAKEQKPGADKPEQIAKPAKIHKFQGRSQPQCMQCHAATSEQYEEGGK